MSELKKKMPNMASPTSAIVAFAPLKVELRNSERSSIGMRWCSSTNAKITSATTAIANSVNTRVEVHA